MSQHAPKGFRMPAEWEPQAAIWLSWPVNTHIWPGQKTAIWDTFAAIATRFSRYQHVAINAASHAHKEIETLLNRAKCDLSVTTLYDHPTDDVWCRDHGPVWLKNDSSGEVAICHWHFNAWGGKFTPFDKDDRVPAHIAKSLNLQRFVQEEILEGGGIESNGKGVLLTTEAVLLNENRGKGHNRGFWEQRLRGTLAIDDVVWLRDGLPNDDTDGHIDNIARFTENGPVLAVEPDGVEVLEENLATLKRRFGDVVTLPRPEFYLDDMRAPASYANYVVLNDGVLVPSYGDKKMDETALGLVQDCFKGRKGELFDCRLFIEEGGALHCLTTNQPA